MFKLYDNVKISKDVFIGEYSVIGKPARPKYVTRGQKDPLDLRAERSSLETVISLGCYIDAYVIIEEGVFIGPNCIIESGCLIEKGSLIDANSLIVHGARLLQGARISSNTIIGGFIADNSVVGNNCRIFGKLLHKQDDPYLPWDDNKELSPIIDDNVFVGVDAKIIGGVHISSHVYVCSGAFVTKNVPSNCVVKGENVMIPISQWPGKLNSSLFWRMRNE